MAKAQVMVGSTQIIVNLFIGDSRSSSGAGLTGLDYQTSGKVPTVYYKRTDATGATQISLANITTLGTWVSGGFKEISAANMPGWYEFHIPNACVVSGRAVGIALYGANYMVPCNLEIELTAVNNQDAAAGGMTNLVGIWRDAFKKIVKTFSGTSGNIARYADDGTTVTSNQVITDDGSGNQTRAVAG